MSFNNPGYVPPPPPPVPARRSPWVYVGAGCGVLLLLMAGCTAVMVGKVKQAVSQPLDRAAAVKKMADTPVYPEAELDETMTKSQQFAIGMTRASVPADDANVIAYRTEASPDKVTEWYAKQLEKQGWKETSAADLSKIGTGMHQAQYRKGKDLLLIQTQQTGRDKADTVIVLVRFTNVKSDKL